MAEEGDPGTSVTLSGSDAPSTDGAVRGDHSGQEWGSGRQHCGPFGPDAAGKE